MLRRRYLTSVGRVFRRCVWLLCRGWHPCSRFSIAYPWKYLNTKKGICGLCRSSYCHASFRKGLTCLSDRRGVGEPESFAIARCTIDSTKKVVCPHIVIHMRLGASSFTLNRLDAYVKSKLGCRQDVITPFFYFSLPPSQSAGAWTTGRPGAPCGASPRIVTACELEAEPTPSPASPLGRAPDHAQTPPEQT